MTAAADARRSPPLLAGLRLPGPGLTLAVALISLLASIDITGASVLARTAPRWTDRLSGSATVATTGRDLESADAAAARAAEILSRAPAVADVRVLDPAPVDALAARVMGLSAGAPTTAPPRLLAVRFRPGSAMTADGATALLRRNGLVVAADDHGPWSGPVERLGIAAAGVVGVVLLGLLAALASLIGWATRRAARGRRDRLALLVQLGAGAGALAGPFRSRAVASAIAGGALGTGASIAAGAILAFEPAAAIRLSVWLPSMPGLTGLDVGLGLLWLPLAVALAAVVSQAAARDALRPLT